MIRNKPFNDLTIQEIKDCISKYESEVEELKIEEKQIEKRYNRIKMRLKALEHGKIVYIQRMRYLERYEQPLSKKQ
jgi:hypothetical protein